MECFYLILIAFLCFFDPLATWAMPTDSTLVFPRQDHYKFKATYTIEQLEAMPVLTEHAKEALQSAFNVTNTASLPELKAYIKKVDDYNRNKHSNSSLTKRARLVEWIHQYSEMDNWTRPPGNGSFTCYQWADHTEWRFREVCENPHWDCSKNDFCIDVRPTREVCCANYLQSTSNELTPMCDKYGGGFPSGKWPVIGPDQVYDSLMCSRFCPLKEPGDCTIWHPDIVGIKMNPYWCLCKFAKCAGWAENLAGLNGPCDQSLFSVSGI